MSDDRRATRREFLRTGATGLAGAALAASCAIACKTLQSTLARRW